MKDPEPIVGSDPSRSSDHPSGMPAAFDPAAIEQEWSRRWQAARLFQANPRSGRPHYSIAVPPPNVTGELHMGHATNATLQDVWARYKRMGGYEVLWLPGTDHAAIATQNVIERQLAREGKSKEEIGREAFADRVERWYQSVGSTIIAQFGELGASLDFSRLRFTMDPGYVRAVRAAFVHYFERGWLYRGPRIVNWCPTCMSAISDLEVDWREHDDELFQVAYDLEGGGRIAIATARPETILADSGIAVHPDDPRHRELVGRTAILPLGGRRLPIVADAAVDPDFGTGVLKITPGHDPLDWEIGARHGLEVRSCISPRGLIEAPGSVYDGLPVAEARDHVVADLSAEGRLLRRDPLRHQVGHCDRSGDVIEPLVSEQWFLRMEDLAQHCIRASREGAVRWHPERYEKTYLDWLGGIKDWCVSRQLWLGHRIPVYTCDKAHVFAAVEEPRVCPNCGSSALTQDPDVLDTWFSSALWPFATLGWPEPGDELEAFYPTALNVTARDIINLWVTRMIFSGLELTGRVPFSDVIVHATIQAADGRRMSKSLGTGIDPRKIIARYGADGLRAWASLVGMSSQDVRFDESRIEGFRRFSNKLWNATRLILGGMGKEPPQRPGAILEVSDRWILSRLEATRAAVVQGVEGYAFQNSINALYDFTWHDLCDWYLEAAKSRLGAGETTVRWVALEVLDRLLRLLHPFMPFITEDLFQRLPGGRDFLVRSPWPSPEPGWVDPRAEQEMARLVAVVEEIRRLRRAGGRAGVGRLSLASGIEPSLRPLVAELARLELVDDVGEGALELTEAVGRVQFASGSDPQRTQSERRRLVEDIERTEASLANPEFVARAPVAVVAAKRARLEELRAAVERLGSA
ncbi:MAG TPA: valine--tRNA ligase [Candidatus Nitrosotalea sp.]|nr:valine--tRNA ligase [Candidatus Nitrosotalea sp.]